MHANIYKHTYIYIYTYEYVYVFREKYMHVCNQAAVATTAILLQIHYAKCSNYWGSDEPEIVERKEMEAWLAGCERKRQGKMLVYIFQVIVVVKYLNSISIGIENFKFWPNCKLKYETLHRMSKH